MARACSSLNSRPSSPRRTSTSNLKRGGGLFIRIPLQSDRDYRDPPETEDHRKPKWREPASRICTDVRPHAQAQDCNSYDRARHRPSTLAESSKVATKSEVGHDQRDEPDRGRDRVPDPVPTELLGFTQRRTRGKAKSGIGEKQSSGDETHAEKAPPRRGPQVPPRSRARTRRIPTAQPVKRTPASTKLVI